MEEEEGKRGGEKKGNLLPHCKSGFTFKRLQK